MALDNPCCPNQRCWGKKPPFSINLPKKLIWFGFNRRINYYYNFDGAKLRKRVETFIINNFKRV